jgi:hypothetical protein
MRPKSTVTLIHAGLLVAASLFLSAFSTGGRDASPGSLSSEIYFLDSPAEHSRRLERFIKKNIQLTEEEKIRYLLHAIGTSKATFIRNGLEYKSGRAVFWLRRKMMLAKKRHTPVLTAQDFVQNIARRSESSGKPYELILPCGTRVAAYDVFRHELEALEKAFTATRPAHPGSPLSII